jgi:hypothetical protein
MKALTATRIAGLLVLTALVGAFVAYLVVNVPIHPKGLHGDQKFKHLLVLVDAIVIVAIVDAVTIAAAIRRRKKEGAR